jgi:hypothetical protein
MKRNLIKGTLSSLLPIGSGRFIGESGLQECEKSLFLMARPDPNKVCNLNKKT